MDLSRLRLRAPLLWLLIPLITGYALGESANLNWGIAPLAVGLAFIIMSVVVPALDTHRGHIWWILLLPLGMVGMSWSYYHWRNLEMRPWQGQTPREAVIQLRVDRIFATPSGHDYFSGYGEVLSAPEFARDLLGRKLYASFRNRAQESIVRSTVINITGVLRPLDTISKNPDFIHYLENLGISAGLKQGRLIEVSEKGTAFQRFCARAKDKLTATLKAGAAPDNPYVGIYAGMLLGDKAELDPEWRTAYIHTGTMHLFAISGLHVVAIAGCIALFLGLIRIPMIPRALIGLLLLALYVQITGAAPSAVRAWIMVTGFWMGRILARQSTPFSAWTVSAFFVLLYQPRMLWDAGFQLSYLVVAGILLYGVPFGQWLETAWQPYALIPYASRTWRQRKVEQTYRTVVSALAVTVAASIASMPLTIMHFKTLPLISLLLNLVLVPLAGVIVITGLVSMAFGMIGCIGVSAFINHAAWVQVAFMNTLIGKAQNIPCSWFEVRFFKPEFGLILAAFLLCSLVAVVPLHRKRPGAGWLLPVVVVVIGLDLALFLPPQCFP